MAVAPYRAGVIGCGKVGSSLEDVMRQTSIRLGMPYGHAAAYRATPRVTLVAGADTDAAQRRAFAERWGVPTAQVYADYQEMLARERLDIVSIATPTPLHAAMALAAVEAGVRAIFLEKPIASNLADAERVVRVCAERGVILAVNHSRRGDPLYRQARRLIDEGAIGRLHSVVAFFNGHLMVTGTHAFDVCNYFAGDMPLAWAQGDLDEPPGFDPGGSAYFSYQSGVRGFVNAESGNSVSFRLHAVGTAGEIVIGNHDLALWRADLSNPRRDLLLHPFPQVVSGESSMVVLLNELLDALEGGPEPVSNGVTATNALALAVAMHASAQQGGARVRFPLAARDLTILSL